MLWIENVGGGRVTDDDNNELGYVKSMSIDVSAGLPRYDPEGNPIWGSRQEGVIMLEIHVTDFETLKEFYEEASKQPDQRPAL